MKRFIVLYLIFAVVFGHEKCWYDVEYLKENLKMDGVDTWWFMNRGELAQSWNWQTSKKVKKITVNGIPQNGFDSEGCSKFNTEAFQTELKNDCYCLQSWKPGYFSRDASIGTETTWFYFKVTSDKKTWLLNRAPEGSLFNYPCECLPDDLEMFQLGTQGGNTAHKQIALTECLLDLFPQHRLLPCQFSYKCIVVDNAGHATYYTDCSDVPQNLTEPIYMTVLPSPNTLDNQGTSDSKNALKFLRTVAKSTKGTGIHRFMGPDAPKWNNIRCFGLGSATKYCTEFEKNMKTIWSIAPTSDVIVNEIIQNKTIALWTLTDGENIGKSCQFGTCILVQFSRGAPFDWPKDSSIDISAAYKSTFEQTNSDPLLTWKQVSAIGVTNIEREATKEQWNTFDPQRALCYRINDNVEVSKRWYMCQREKIECSIVSKNETGDCFRNTPMALKFVETENKRYLIFPNGTQITKNQPFKFDSFKPHP